MCAVTDSQSGITVGNLLNTTSGYFCVAYSFKLSISRLISPGGYSVLYKRYLRDPSYVQSSSSDTAVPSTAVAFGAPTQNVFACAAPIDGTLTSGLLFMSNGRPMCWVTMLYPLGLVTTQLTAGSYAALEGTACVLGKMRIA